jgi:hypothetical protein
MEGAVYYFFSFDICENQKQTASDIPLTMSGMSLRVTMFLVFIAVVELIPEPEEKLKPEPAVEYVKVINLLSKNLIVYTTSYKFLQLEVYK